jgi:adenylate kinase family enzyme
MRDLLFIAGGPASGKSILANKLRNYFHGITISTSKLAKYLSVVYEDRAIYGGDYFPYEPVLRNSVKTMIDHCPIPGVPIIIDGMPRHPSQLEWVRDTFLYSDDIYNVYIILLQSDAITTLARMSKRSDVFDNHDIIHKRIDAQLPAIDEMVSLICDTITPEINRALIYNTVTTTEEYIYDDVLYNLIQLEWGYNNESIGH